MKKVKTVKAIKLSTPMSKPSSDKARLLHKLAEAAKAARTRVSGYSDEKRHELERLARGVIQGAKAKSVCRS